MVFPGEGSRCVILWRGEQRHGAPWRGEQKHGAPWRGESERVEMSHLHHFSPMAL